MAAQDQREWISRVIGVDLPTGGPVSEAELREALGEDYDELFPAEEEAEAEALDPQTLYDDAREQIAGGITALTTMMRAQDHPIFDRLADFGLLGLTDGQHVGLTKSLLQYRSAQGDARLAAAKAVQGAVDAYRAHLGKSIFKGLDENPFGVDVGFTTALDRALQRISSAVA